MPSAKAAKSPARKAARKAAPAKGPVAARPVRQVAPAFPAPAPPPQQPVRRIEEPVWLVRAVLLLFLVGFAAFLARQVYSFLRSF